MNNIKNAPDIIKEEVIAEKLKVVDGYLDEMDDAIEKIERNGYRPKTVEDLVDVMNEVSK